MFLGAAMIAGTALAASAPAPATTTAPAPAPAAAQPAAVSAPSPAAAQSATMPAHAASAPAPVTYIEVTQAELSGNLEKYADAKVAVKGDFLFTGSDFCYQVRKTTINTKDYLCFALGPMNLVRFYLKKDHEQIPELMSTKKGQMIKALGTFGSLGVDYKFIIVDKLEIEAPK
jgi:hypothetical protein